MRDFDLLRAARRWSEADEQTRISTIYGGAETGDPARGRATRRHGERGVPAARAVAVGVLPMACGSPGRLAVALKRDAQRTARKDDPEVRHKAEMERMRAVIAEITAENLELKKRI